MHVLHPIGPLIFCQLGPGSQLPGYVLFPTGLSECVSVLGTRCVWPRVCVCLWCIFSSWELSPCGHVTGSWKGECLD